MWDKSVAISQTPSVTCWPVPCRIKHVSTEASVGQPPFPPLLCLTQRELGNAKAAEGVDMTHSQPARQAAR